MDFINRIVAWLNAISSYFYNLYIQCLYAHYIPNVIAELMYALSVYFSMLAWDFYYFGIWVDNVAYKVSTILSFTDIFNYFRSYFEAAITAWYWVVNAYQNIIIIITSWWSTTSSIVQGWIETARLGLMAWIEILRKYIYDLQIAWGNFRIYIPDILWALDWVINAGAHVRNMLTSWWNEKLLDIQSLINSAFILRNDFWAGWQDWRNKVVEFFADPEDWLYKAVDRIVERFW